MTLIEFPEQTTVIAKDQPEYLPFPAHMAGDAAGTIFACWKLSPEEIEVVRKTGVIWHSILTCNRPLQPQMLSVEKPVMIPAKAGNTGRN